MNDRISLQDFHFNTVSMLNLLHQAESAYPAGPERDKAYAQVGIDLGLGDDAFIGLA